LPEQLTTRCGRARDLCAAAVVVADLPRMCVVHHHPSLQERSVAQMRRPVSAYLCSLLDDNVLAKVRGIIIGKWGLFSIILAAKNKLLFE